MPPQLSPEAREHLRHQTVKVALELEHDVATRLRREAARRILNFALEKKCPFHRHFSISRRKKSNNDGHFEIPSAAP